MVDDQQCDRDDRLCSRLGDEVNQSREEVANRDSLEYPGNANRRKMKVRKARQKFAEQKNDHGTNDDFDEECAAWISSFNSFSERQRNRHANDEKEERKDQIGGCPAIPLRVLERPINV